MQITLTLDEAACLCDWDEFCRVTGFDVDARAEGGGHVKTTLTEEQARELGLLPASSPNTSPD